MFQKHIEKKQSRVIRLAEGLRALQAQEFARSYRNTLVTKNIERRAKIFLKENNAAFHQNQNRNAYFRALLRAESLLNTGKINWRHTVRGLIILAIIYLREEKQMGHINKIDLREIVTAHHQLKGQSGSIDDRFWRRSLAHPDIVRLLSAL